MRRDRLYLVSRLKPHVYNLDIFIKLIETSELHCLYCLLIVFGGETQD